MQPQCLQPPTVRIINVLGYTLTQTLPLPPTSTHVHTQPTTKMVSANNHNTQPSASPPTLLPQAQSNKKLHDHESRLLPVITEPQTQQTVARSHYGELSSRMSFIRQRLFSSVRLRTLEYGDGGKAALWGALGPVPGGTRGRQPLTTGSPPRFGDAVCGAG